MKSHKQKYHNKTENVTCDKLQTSDYWLRGFLVFWLASARRRTLEIQPAAASCMIESPSPTSGSSFWNKQGTQINALCYTIYSGIIKIHLIHPRCLKCEFWGKTAKTERHLSGLQPAEFLYWLHADHCDTQLSQHLAWTLRWGNVFFPNVSRIE